MPDDAIGALYRDMERIERQCHENQDKVMVHIGDLMSQVRNQEAHIRELQTELRGKGIEDFGLAGAVKDLRTNEERRTRWHPWAERAVVIALVALVVDAFTGVLRTAATAVIGP